MAIGLPGNPGLTMTGSFRSWVASTAADHKPRSPAAVADEQDAASIRRPDRLVTDARQPADFPFVTTVAVDHVDMSFCGVRLHVGGIYDPLTVRGQSGRFQSGTLPPLEGADRLNRSVG